MKHRCLRFSAVAVCAIVFVPAASGVESTITPGLGIGKIRVGMTRAQVEKVLGREALLDERTTVGSTAYVEYGWDFGSWTVGFLRQGATLRVAQVATSLRAQRTVSGIGVGSSFKAVVRAYPQAVCRGYFVSMGTRIPKGPPWRTASDAIVVAKNRRQVAFLVHPADTYDYTGRWVVYQVIVRNSIPGAVDFEPKYQCNASWRQLGRPHPTPFVP